MGKDNCDFKEAAGVNDSEFNALLSRNKELTDALDKAAYSLFKIKRMGVSDEVVEYASSAHMAACKILDAER